MNSVEVHTRDKHHIIVDCIFDLMNEDLVDMFPIIEKLCKDSGVAPLTSNDMNSYIYLPEEDDGSSGNVGNHIKISARFSDAYAAGYFACKAWFLLNHLSIYEKIPREFKPDDPTNRDH